MVIIMREKILFVTLMIAAIATFLASCRTVIQNVQSSSFVIIELRDFYEGQGAVVPAEYPMPIGRMVGRFAPEIQHIVKGETIFKNNLIALAMTDSSIDFDASLKITNNKYRTYNRYYVGYTNQQGQKILEIYLFNYRSRAAKKQFSGWEKDVILGAGDFWEQNTWSVFVNLDTDQIN